MSFKQHIDEAANLYRQGWSLQQIADRYHRTRQAVNYAFDMCGIERRPRGGRNNPLGLTNRALAGMHSVDNCHKLRDKSGRFTRRKA